MLTVRQFHWDGTFKIIVIKCQENILCVPYVLPIKTCSSIDEWITLAQSKNKEESISPLFLLQNIYKM